MNPLILMAIIGLVPVLLIVLARVKAAFVFMSLAVGVILSNYVGDTALDMVQTFVRGYNATTQSMVQIGLLIVPVLLTLLFLNRSLSNNKTIINIFPAILTGLTVLFLVVPLLPPGTSNGIYGNSIWLRLGSYQAALISAAALISLAQLWGSGHGSRDKDKKKKKH